VSIVRDRKRIATTKHTDVIARNKAVVRAYYDGAERGDISGFGGFLHQDFEVHAPNYLPWGGTHRGTETFLQVILPQAAKALDFGRFGYERFTAEGDHVVVLIRVGVAGTDALIKISEHWVLKDEKALSLWVRITSLKRLWIGWKVRPPPVLIADRISQTSAMGSIQDVGDLWE
jgi:ketosteroid isomerase-like protein